jgi:hypothetical protein
MDWIERLFGIGFDHGDGSLEGSLTLVLVAAAALALAAKAIAKPRAVIARR